MGFKEFEDYEAFTDTLLDFRSRFLIPKMDRRRWAIHRVEIGGLSIQLCEEGGGKIVHGKVCREGYLLYGQIAGDVGRVEGFQSTPHHLALLSPNKSFVIACPSSHSWYSIFVPFNSLPKKVPISVPEDSGEKVSDSYSNSSHDSFVLEDALHSESIAKTVRDVLEAVGSQNTKAKSEIEDLVQEKIVSTASEILTLKEKPKEVSLGRPLIDRDAVLKAILDWTESTTIQEQGRADLKTLAKVAKVSERTLRTVFVERFYVPPAKYLRLLRFRNARTCLRTAKESELTVANIAAENGFWDFGRFAIDYRMLYGERPSETLAKSLASK